LGALQVHGITNNFAQQPRFAEVVDELIEFIGGAELIIHNAALISFLDAELRRLPGPAARLHAYAACSTRCLSLAYAQGNASAWTHCVSATASTTRGAGAARC
jgi:DNA polymerase III epsilon subunit-like protein